jgi:hypothetical protein
VPHFGDPAASADAWAAREGLSFVPAAVIAFPADGDAVLALGSSPVVDQTPVQQPMIVAATLTTISAVGGLAEQEEHSDGHRGIADDDPGADHVLHPRMRDLTRPRSAEVRYLCRCCLLTVG